MGLKYKKMNKKAMFFTILAIALLSLFAISYTFYSVIEDRQSINKRIETMNSFVFSLEQDMSRQIYISSYRAILSIEEHITSQGKFLDSARDSIEEVLINGTIENQPVNLMEGYKLEDWNSRVSELGNKQNILINYSLKNLTIKQEDPWNIKVEMTIDIFIKDKGNLAFWNKTQIISSEIEIIGFEDPLYLINTNGKIANKINKTIYENFTIPNLILHNQNMYYKASSTAPSFLDRLEGKTSANENGIESLVYLPKLSEQGVAIKDKSCVDYIYFSSNNPESQNVAGMPSWFKLDTEHLSVYT